MYSKDKKHFHHLLDAAGAAMALVQGKTANELFKEPSRVLALVKAIEWIDRSAHELSPEVKARYQDIPWDYVEDMFTFIHHGDDDINLNALWYVVAEVISPLLFSLEQIFPPDAIA